MGGIERVDHEKRGSGGGAPEVVLGGNALDKEPAHDELVSLRAELQVAIMGRDFWYVQYVAASSQCEQLVHREVTATLVENFENDSHCEEVLRSLEKRIIQAIATHFVQPTSIGISSIPCS